MLVNFLDSYMMQLILSIVLLSICFTMSSSEHNRCVYIGYRGEGGTGDAFKTKCARHDVCGRRLTVSYIDIPPYSTGKIFESIVEGCCGRSCVNFDIVSHYTNISEVDLSRRNSSDFILPFLGSSAAIELYGYHFIPFADVPPAYYITPKHAPPVSRMMRKCGGLYTLMLLCLMACAVSGFIVWALESFLTTKHTDQSFFGGFFDGFWWSFTTVTSGYGAKIVLSTPAKLYTVIWILGGVIIFSLMTSTFTAELMQYMRGHYDSMAGGTVGVLKYRDYDASLVVRHGGVIKETEAENFHADLLMLLRMLRTQEVDGVLLDKYTWVYAKGYLHWMMDNIDFRINDSPLSYETAYDELRADIEYFTADTEYNLRHYDGERLSYGVLVKNTRHYEYLKAAVRDNRLSLETATESEMNRQFPRILENVMDPNHALSQTHVLTWFAFIICFICLFGIAYEIYSKVSRKRKQETSTLGNELANVLAKVSFQ